MNQQEFPKIPLKTATLIAAVGAVLQVVLNVWNLNLPFSLTMSVGWICLAIFLITLYRNQK